MFFEEIPLTDLAGECSGTSPEVAEVIVRERGMNQS